MVVVVGACAYLDSVSDRYCDIRRCSRNRVAALDMTNRLQIDGEELRLNGQLVGFITAPRHLHAAIKELIDTVEECEPLQDTVADITSKLETALSEFDPDDEEQAKTLEALQAAANVLELNFDIHHTLKECKACLVALEGAAE